MHAIADSGGPRRYGQRVKLATTIGVLAAAVALWAVIYFGSAGRDLDRKIERDDRRARQREFERAEQRAEEARCGARVEMLTSDGDVYMVCPDDVRDAQGRGWIVRYQDAGVTGM